MTVVVTVGRPQFTFLTLNPHSLQGYKAFENVKNVVRLFFRLAVLKNVVMMQFHKKADLSTCLNFVLLTNQNDIDHLFPCLSYLTHISMQPHAHARLVLLNWCEQVFFSVSNL